MLKKKFIVSLSTLAILAVPFSVFAATSGSATAKHIRGFFGLDTSKLTDAQKADMKSYSEKFVNLEKEYINQMVSDGSMTKEAGDAALKKIDEKIASGDDYAFLPGIGGGRECRGGGLAEGSGSMMGRGGFFGVPGLDTSKLTDAQKTDVVGYLVNIANQEKENLTSLVSSGIMTQDEATSTSTKIDEKIANLQTNGLTQTPPSAKPQNGNFDPGKDMKEHKQPTTLTDAQKAVLEGNQKKINDLRKGLISKLVSDGALTAEQGTAATTAIDNAKNHVGKDFKGGKGFGGHSRGDKSKDNSTAPSSTTTDGAIQ